MDGFEKLEELEAQEKIRLELLQKAEKSPYINPDGTFTGGFKGCVAHFTEEKGYTEEHATKMCAYLGREAGKIP